MASRALLDERADGLERLVDDLGSPRPRAARPPRPSTCVLDAMPVLPTQRWSDPRTRTRSSASPFAEEDAAAARRDRRVDAAGVAVEDALPGHRALLQRVVAGARVECARDRDADRRRAPEPAARRQIGVDLDVDGACDGDGPRGGVEQRAKGARQVVLARRPRGRRCSIRCTSSRLGPVLAGAAPRRARPALDADRERRDAVDDRVLAEQDDLAPGDAGPMLISSTLRQGLDGALRASARPAWASVGAARGPRATRAISASIRASTRARAPHARWRATASASSSVASTSATRRARGPAHRAARASRRRLDDERGALALAQVAPAGLPVATRIAERAEQVVAQLERDAERRGEGLERRAPGPRARPRAARPSATGPRTV